MSEFHIFNYMNYREFFGDWIAVERAKRRGFSFRRFAKQAGLKSHNTCKWVLDGKRNLSESSISKFADGLKLSDLEREFFRVLVLYTQTDAPKLKDSYREKLLSLKRFHEIETLRKDQYEIMSTWYHLVVRELVTHPHFDGTPAWIVGHLGPPLNEADVTESIALLTRLGFIKKNKQGRYRQAHALLSTGEEARNMAILRYHQSVLDLMNSEFPKVRSEDRDLSALVLGIPKSQLGALKKDIQEFRKKILKKVSNESAVGEVALLSIQLLPLTRNLAEGTP